MLPAPWVPGSGWLSEVRYVDYVRCADIAGDRPGPALASRAMSAVLPLPRYVSCAMGAALQVPRLQQIEFAHQPARRFVGDG
jgi:hypothetical protein